jgi:hypothetical protein
MSVTSCGTIKDEHADMFAVITLYPIDIRIRSNASAQLLNDQDCNDHCLSGRQMPANTAAIFPNCRKTTLRIPIVLVLGLTKGRNDQP